MYMYCTYRCLSTETRQSRLLAALKVRRPSPGLAWPGILPDCHTVVRHAFAVLQPAETQDLYTMTALRLMTLSSLLIGMLAIALAWWATPWRAQWSSYNEHSVSPGLRLRELCDLQSTLGRLDRPHTCAILLELRRSSAPSSSTRPTASAPLDQLNLPWPVLPHELLGIDLGSVQNLKPRARQRILADAWKSRTEAILGLGQRSPAGGGMWALPGLFGGKPPLRAGDRSTLEGELIMLGNWASAALADEKTWDLYMDKMVFQGDWWGGWLDRDNSDDEHSRVMRLRQACQDFQRP